MYGSTSRTSELRAGDAAHAGRYVAASHDHVREPAGHVLQGQRESGAVKGKVEKGKGVEDKGKGRLVQVEKRRRQEVGREEQGEAVLLLEERSHQERLQKPPVWHEEGERVRNAGCRQKAGSRPMKSLVLDRGRPQHGKQQSRQRVCREGEAKSG